MAARETLEKGWVRRFISNVYVRVLLNRLVKAAVIAMFLAYLGVSIYGITKLNEGQPLQVRQPLLAALFFVPGILAADESLALLSLKETVHVNRCHQIDSLRPCATCSLA